MSETHEKEPVEVAPAENNPFSTKGGRWPVFIKLLAVVGVCSAIGEAIGTIRIPIGPGNFIMLPMVFAMVIAVLFTPDALGKKIGAFKKAIDKEECKLASSMVMMALLLLAVALSVSAGMNILSLLSAGPALILQELGNLGTMFVALPIAMLLGMRREAVGGTVSICREPTLGIIGEIYGIDSPEGLGVMGTYMCGNLFGTIFFGFLGSFAVFTGLHPWALGMACGIGSGSMLSASSAALNSAVTTMYGPEMAEQTLAYASMSNVLTNIDGTYMELLLALPMCNWMYSKWIKLFDRKKKSV